MFSSELGHDFKVFFKNQILQNAFEKKIMVMSTWHCKTALGSNELLLLGGKAFIWVSISNSPVNFIPEKGCTH